MTIDLAHVRHIVGVEDATVRNLMITQAYWELSRDASLIVGRDNATWATFGCWASKTAGSFIRGDGLPDFAARQLVGSLPVRQRAATMESVSRDLPGDLRSPLDLVRDKAEQITRDVGLYIEAGNKAVFAEMGEAYARFNEAMVGGLSHDGLSRLLAHFTVGPPEPDKVSLDWDKKKVTTERRGGQGLLRQMLENYFLAAQETDRRRRAQFVLLGNAVGGIHEQTRLQGYIFKSLNAPIDDFLRRDLQLEHDDYDGRPLTDRTEGVVERLGLLLADAAKAEWRRFATDELMRMRLPGGTVLDLGRDIHPRPGRPLFLPPLERIQLAPLADLLAQYGALSRRRPCRDVLAAVEQFVARVLERRCGELLTTGSGAHDWARLPERMRYILTLFRCHQRNRTMFDRPFSVDQTRYILAGEVPDGDL